MKEFIETGKIVNIHGLRGEVKIMPWSDDPDFICGFDILYCGKDKKIFEIESARVHKNMVLIKFKGIDTPESANFLRNNIVYIDRNDVELEEGTYFNSGPHRTESDRRRYKRRIRHCKGCFSDRR